mmetsp:Transcript_11392/g.19357  ORF Transcript_11392/g.19357 Transcript_11392/m.19357 type:complete len:225 (+) Transcript_11392:179-853(+)
MPSSSSVQNNISTTHNVAIEYEHDEARETTQIPPAQLTPLPAPERVIVVESAQAFSDMPNFQAREYDKFTLSEDEVVLFSYQWTVKMLAVIDGFFTLLNLFTLGYPTDGQSHNLWLVILGLCFIVGPIFGYFGASYLLKIPVFIYLVFVVAKTFFQILAFIYVPYFWLLFCAFVQMWIMQIVVSFAIALSRISTRRLSDLREEGFLNEAVRVRQARQNIRIMYY